MIDITAAIRNIFLPYPKTRMLVEVDFFLTESLVRTISASSLLPNIPYQESLRKIKSAFVALEWVWVAMYEALGGRGMSIWEDVLKVSAACLFISTQPRDTTEGNSWDQ